MDLDLFGEPILAIESSCDETSAAVVVGREIRSNIIASQIEMHKKWGGIVPEAAARAHVEAVLPVIEEALQTAAVHLRDIRAVAVTNRPGLVGALSVGLTAAKALAFSLQVPLLGIHHLEGHICSAAVGIEDVIFPHTCLIVSGGHTELVQVDAPGQYRLLGETRDDAAGEAFDKGARLLGLGYPGGKAIQDLAAKGDPRRYPLPRGLSGDTVDFSFSGLKTATLRLVQKEGESISVPDAAASLQEAIISVLTERAVRACVQNGSTCLTVVGGVAANLELRQRLLAECQRNDIRFFTPPIEVCTDNAGMIGLAASYRLALGQSDGFDLDVLPNAPLPE